jgi:hypothetical protein
MTKSGEQQEAASGLIKTRTDEEDEDASPQEVKAPRRSERVWNPPLERLDISSVKGQSHSGMEIKDEWSIKHVSDKHQVTTKNATWCAECDCVCAQQGHQEMGSEHIRCSAEGKGATTESKLFCPNACTCSH